MRKLAKAHNLPSELFSTVNVRSLKNFIGAKVISSVYVLPSTELDFKPHCSCVCISNFLYKVKKNTIAFPETLVRNVLCSSSV